MNVLMNTNQVNCMLLHTSRHLQGGIFIVVMLSTYTEKLNLSSSGDSKQQKKTLISYCAANLRLCFCICRLWFSYATAQLCFVVFFYC